MTRRRGTPAPTYTPGTLLDWTDHAHWSWLEKPCRYCEQPTQLRDSKRRPAHKTCAERALAEQAYEAADAYQLGS